MVKNLPANAEDVRDESSISELGRSPGEGNSNPLRYSCLENSIDRGALRGTVQGGAESWVRLQQLRTHTGTQNKQSCQHLGKGANPRAFCTRRFHQVLPFASQVNSLRLADPVEAVLQLQDCGVFIRIIDGM